MNADTEKPMIRKSIANPSIWVCFDKARRVDDGLSIPGVFGLTAYGKNPIEAYELWESRYGARHDR